MEVLKKETATYINNVGHHALTVGKTYDIVSKTYDEQDMCHIVIMNDIDVIRKYPGLLFMINSGGL